MKDPKRQKAGRMSRRKGKSTENVQSHKWNDWASLPYNKEGSFRRWWAGREETGRKGDLKVPDFFPFIIEIRNREGWTFSSIFGGTTNTKPCTLLQWWYEMLEKNGYAPLFLIFTKNRQPDYVMYSGVERKIIEDIFGSIQSGGFPVMRVWEPVKRESLFIAKLSHLLDFMDPEGFKALVPDSIQPCIPQRMEN